MVLGDDEFDIELTEEEEKRVALFTDSLAASVDAIPPALMHATEELATADPRNFEAALGTMLECVGHGFWPTALPGCRSAKCSPTAIAPFCPPGGEEELDAAEATAT